MLTIVPGSAVGRSCGMDSQIRGVGGQFGPCDFGYLRHPFDQPEGKGSARHTTKPSVYTYATVRPRPYGHLRYIARLLPKCTPSAHNVTGATSFLVARTRSTHTYTQPSPVTLSLSHVPVIPPRHPDGYQLQQAVEDSSFRNR